MVSERRSIPTPALILGISGLLPFAFSTILIYFPDNISFFPNIFNQSAANPAMAGSIALGAYGAVILSFLGGVRWGNLLEDQKQLEHWLPLSLSVLPSLIAWPALLLKAPAMLLVLTLGFVVQYLLDIRGVRQGLLPNWFGKLRLLLSCGAIFCLVVGLAGVLGSGAV